MDAVMDIRGLKEGQRISLMPCTLPLLFSKGRTY